MSYSFRNLSLLLDSKGIRNFKLRLKLNLDKSYVRERSSVSYSTNTVLPVEQCIRIDTKANREHDRLAVARKEGKRGTRMSGGGQMRLLARCSESVHNTAALTAPWITERVLPPPAI